MEESNSVATGDGESWRLILDVPFALKPMIKPITVVKLRALVGLQMGPPI